MAQANTALAEAIASQNNARIAAVAVLAVQAEENLAEARALDAATNARVDTSVTAIATNATAIDTNRTTIRSNTSAISTNRAAISTNRAAISTNAANIDNNSKRIAAESAKTAASINALSSAPVNGIGVGLGITNDGGQAISVGYKTMLDASTMFTSTLAADSTGSVTVGFGIGWSF